MSTTTATSPGPRVLICRGLLFDGGGKPGAIRDVGVAGGVLLAPLSATVPDNNERQCDDARF